MLTVPASTPSAPPEIVDPANDPRASTAFVPVRPRKLPAQIAGRSSAEGRSTWYVKRGQTLQMIADSSGTTVENLMRWNRLTSRRVRPGALLQVRSGAAALESPGVRDSIQIATLVPPPRSRHSAGSSASGARTHTVRRGETLSGIASRYGVSLQAIRRANGMQSNKLLAGQKLRLPV